MFVQRVTDLAMPRLSADSKASTMVQLSRKSGAEARSSSLRPTRLLSTPASSGLSKQPSSMTLMTQKSWGADSGRSLAGLSSRVSSGVDQL